MPRKAMIDPSKPRVETRGRKKLTVDSPLTPRQEAFVRELVLKDGMITKREAAENAGYAAESAPQRAYELTDPRKHPNVVARINALRSELDAKFGVTYERHLRDLQVIRDRALENGAYSAAVQAEYRRGQAHGDIYISKSEVRHGSIDSMSKEDVLKALEEIKRAQGQGTIIDVTPEASEEASAAYDAADRRLAAPSGGHEGEPAEGGPEGEAALEESEGWDEEDEAWDQSDEA